MIRSLFQPAQARAAERRHARRLKVHEPAVHFHPGPEGRPVVCDHARCIRPHLDPAEA